MTVISVVGIMMGGKKAVVHGRISVFVKHVGFFCGGFKVMPVLFCSLLVCFIGMDGLRSFIACVLTSGKIWVDFLDLVLQHYLG